MSTSHDPVRGTGPEPGEDAPGTTLVGRGTAAGDGGRGPDTAGAGAVVLSAPVAAHIDVSAASTRPDPFLADPIFADPVPPDPGPGIDRAADAGSGRGAGEPFPRFLGGFGFHEPEPVAADQPEAARSRRALIVLSIAAAVTISGMAGALVLLGSGSSGGGPQTGPHAQISGGQLLASGNPGNAFSPPYFGQPPTDTGNVYPRNYNQNPAPAATTTSRSPSHAATSSRPAAPVTSAPSGGPSTTAVPAPSSTCPSLPQATSLVGALVCPLLG